MLNRNLSNNDYRIAFGGRKYPYSPEFLLIDEVHLYSGAYGAQFAYLIRRWETQLPKLTSISFVGLASLLLMQINSLRGLRVCHLAGVSLYLQIRLN